MFFFFKQKTAYEMRISDWSSDVCSSDLSRAGDPDLHTHVAVANKVQTKQGKWLSIYGTILHEHVVAASEAYNTALEAHLHAQLGLRFVDVRRPGGKRPVREISGVDPMLMKQWSSRRADIEDRVDRKSGV